MILADTSVWIDHFRDPSPTLMTYLERETVHIHPLIAAEISMGSLADRAGTLWMLDRLWPVPTPEIDEVRIFVETNRLYSKGIGFIDATLLVSCKLLPGLRLWTRDRRLNLLSQSFGIAFQPLH